MTRKSSLFHLSFKLVHALLAVASPAAAVKDNQDISTSYGNHTLALRVRDDRSAPSSPPSQHQPRLAHDAPARTTRGYLPKRQLLVPSGWRSGFCVPDSPNRVFSAFSTSSSSMTPTSCINTCSSLGYSYAGVEAGSECWCGNQFSNGVPTSVPRSDCSMPCSGNSSQTCGAIWYLFWYSSSPNAPYPTTWTTGPCMIDQVSRPLLSTGFTSLISNTPEWCQSQCDANGYQIAGVELGRECWCGNSLSVGSGQTPAGQVVSDSECSMACTGGGASTCGNIWRIKVYELGNILSQYNLDGTTTTTRAASSTTTTGSLGVVVFLAVLVICLLH
jgi:hypothetical protein